MTKNLRINTDVLLFYPAYSNSIKSLGVQVMATNGIFQFTREGFDSHPTIAFYDSHDCYPKGAALKLLDMLNSEHPGSLGRGSLADKFHRSNPDCQITNFSGEGKFSYHIHTSKAGEHTLSVFSTLADFPFQYTGSLDGFINTHAKSDDGRLPVVNSTTRYQRLNKIAKALEQVVERAKNEQLDFYILGEVEAIAEEFHLAEGIKSLNVYIHHFFNHATEKEENFQTIIKTGMQLLALLSMTSAAFEMTSK